MGLFRGVERVLTLDSTVMPPSEQFSSNAPKSPHTLHQYYCNSLALGYLAAAEPHWQIPFVMPSLSPQPEMHWFFFSLILPLPIHFGLLNMKHFNFCLHLYLNNSQMFYFFLPLLKENHPPHAQKKNPVKGNQMKLIYILFFSKLFFFTFINLSRFTSSININIFHIYLDFLIGVALYHFKNATI